MVNIASHLGEAPVGDNEDKLVADIIKSNEMMMEKVDGGLKRAQHPKGHGCLNAFFEVLEIEEEGLRLGIFSEPATYPALIRFSNGARSDDNHDSGDAHGMAIKLLGVVGEKLISGADDDDTFDFVLLDNETFFEGDLEQFSIFNDLSAEIASARRNGEDRLKAVLNGIWLKVFRKLFKEDILSPALETSDQQPVSPLRAKYWSTTPYLLGDDKAVKYIVVPVPEPAVSELTDGVSSPNGLSERLRRDLSTSEAVFNFFVQVQDDVLKHPVEDPTVNWSNAGAKTFPVARIVVSKLGGLTEAEWTEMEARSEAISFNPWNVTANHRPLGAINRARKMVYQETQKLRRN